MSPLTGHREPLRRQTPVISTLIPTFRHPALLGRATHSSLGQTYQSIRISVFDNTSGDDTPDVVRRFSEVDSRVIYSPNSSNIGACQNFHYRRGGSRLILARRCV